MPETKNKIKPIETHIWQKVTEGEYQGYVKKVGPRKVKDVVQDVRNLLESKGLPFDYISTLGVGSQRDVMDWPEGNITIWTEPGGSEGYSVFVGCRGWIETSVQFGPDNPVRMYSLVQPIRIKCLGSSEDALKMQETLLQSFYPHQF